MEGIKNTLMFINDNWTNIIVCVGLVIIIARKVKSYLSMSEQQKIDLAMSQMREIILSFCSEAEVNWEEFSKSGSIKRSEVIAKIYAQYPVLQKVVDQDALIKYIDDMIDESLDAVREVVKTEVKE